MTRSFIFKIVVLLIAAGLLVWLLSNSHSPFGKSNTNFCVPAGSEITSIELSAGNERLTLDRRGEEWFVNGVKEARKTGMMFIDRILHEMKIKSPVSPELYRSEVTDKDIKPVKVKVFQKHKLLTSFLVYKTSSNSGGNIMKLRQSSKPFIVFVPGYDLDVGSAFILNESFWEPYIVFDFLPSEIASVKVENFADSSASFSIVRRRNSFLLSGHKQGWDSTLVSRYVSYYGMVPFESWATHDDDETLKGSSSSAPLYRITLKGVSGKNVVLSLWPKIKKEAGGIVTDSDRLLGKTDGSKDFFIVRYFDIDPILKKRAYFFPQ